MHRIASLTVAALLALGCGGDAVVQDDDPPPDTTAGNETPDPDPVVDEEPEEPDEEPPPATGPGQLTVQLRVRGQNVDGAVQVLDQSGETVAEGRSGQTFAVQSGTYQITAAIEDESIMVDTPTRQHDDRATVSPGQTAEVFVDFPVAMVRLNVQRAGRPVTNWTATVTRQGFDAGEPITLRPSEEHTPITPGRYDATLRTGGQAIEVSGLIFQGGATQSVPVNIN